jgi:hypothetical protein
MSQTDIEDISEKLAEVRLDGPAERTLADVMNAEKREPQKKAFEGG